MSAVTILDGALDELERQLLLPRPERGGALFALRSDGLVVRFALDRAARTTATTYVPSPGLADLVEDVELGDPRVRFAGIAHSHPGLDQPSSQDLVAFADSVRLNPHLGRLVFPILNRWELLGGADEGSDGERASTAVVEAHEVALPSGKLSCFVAEARPGDDVWVGVAPVRVVPLVGDVAAAARLCGGATVGEPRPVVVSGQVLVAQAVEGEGWSVEVAAGGAYPLLAPVVSLASPDGRLVPAPLSWGPQVAHEGSRAEQLAAGIDEARRGRPPAGGGAPGPRPRRPAAVADPVRARGAGVVAAGIDARTASLAGRLLAGRRALVVGAGSVGSFMADELVRAGVEDVVVVDGDLVELANLSRTVYRAGDVGRPKASVLAHHLRQVNPDVQVDAFDLCLQEVDPTVLGEVVATCDLVVGATDDPSCQALVNHWCQHLGVPSLYVGLYAGARAGEVVVSVPGITPCYRCATSVRHAGEAEQPEPDYGTGRLQGEVALGSDIHLVAAAGVKVALGLLLMGRSESVVGDAALEWLSAGQSFLILSTVARWDFFAGVFEGVPGQHAFQSVWMSVERDPACAVCGDAEVRAAPDAVNPRGPDVDAIELPARGEVEPSEVTCDDACS